MEKTDIVIIGAGPTGLFTVFECGMLGLKTHVVDALPHLGGQCQALYPEKPIYDIPAYPKITGGDLTEQLEAQAAPFEPVYHLNQTVTELKQTADGWQVITSKNTTIQATAIIIAAGAGAFAPKKPPLDGIEQYEANGGVAYSVGKIADYADQDVVIAGGGDSAVDWAITLAGVAKSVALVHRRAKFRAAPESVRQLDELAKIGKVELVTPYQLAGLQGDNGQLNHVVVATLDGQERALPADVLLPFYGLSMELGPIAAWGLNLDKNHITIDQGTAATSTAGIFAVGDIATYPHKLKLIATGFAEAAQAAHATYKLARPDQALHFEYSTSKGVPVDA